MHFVILFVCVNTFQSTWKLLLLLGNSWVVTTNILCISGAVQPFWLRKLNAFLLYAGNFSESIKTRIQSRVRAVSPSVHFCSQLLVIISYFCSFFCHFYCGVKIKIFKNWLRWLFPGNLCMCLSANWDFLAWPIAKDKTSWICWGFS